MGSMMKRLLTWIRFTPRNLVLVCLSSLIVTSVWSQTDQDWEALFRQGVYLQDIRGEVAEALKVYESIAQGEHRNDELKAQALYRVIACSLQMHEDVEARDAFQSLQIGFPEQKRWIQAAISIVPDAFLHREIPWVDGERTLFRWINPQGQKVGYAIVSVSQVSKDNGVFWRLESRMIGNDLRRYVIDFEPDSLLPSYSFYQLRRFDPIEQEQYRALGIAADDESLARNTCDHEAAGLLLRQFPFQLGYRAETDLFKASEGGGIPTRVDVTMIETLELADGHTTGCYVVETNMEGEICRFWFENNKRKDLVKYSADGLSGEKLSVEKIGEEPSQEIRVGSSGLRMNCPTEWYPLADPDSEAAKKNAIVFLMPSLDVSFWIEETTELPDSDEAMDESFQQFCESNRYEMLSIRPLGASFSGIVPGGRLMTAAKQTGRTSRAIFRCVVKVDQRSFEAVGQCSEEQMEEWVPLFERAVASLRKGT